MELKKLSYHKNIIDIYTRLEILVGLNLSGHTDTLTEASNLIDEKYKRGEIQKEQQNRNDLNKFPTLLMELPSKLLEQIAFNNRKRTEEHMLKVLDKSTHEEHLSQPLKTNNKQFKIAVTFLTVYIGILNVTDKNKKFYSIKSITDEDCYIQITIPPGAYELENLKKEIKRIFIVEEHYTDSNYPFTIKPIFSTLGSIIEISIQGPVITFVTGDSIRDLLGLSGQQYMKNITLHPILLIFYHLITFF